MREPEPECNCSDCPQSKNGGCAEFNALNPGSMALNGVPYNRGACHWGYESIQKLKEVK